MSIELAAKELRRFLQSPHPEVLCINGNWGVGKTFAWEHFRKEQAAAGLIALNKYSYVSLFGQNSLSDVRDSIFENTRRSETRQNTAGENIRQLTEDAGQNFSKLLKLLSPELRGKFPLNTRILFSSVQNQIVCIDDLERAGKDLSKSDVLGLITQLKEQKKCKVVLLLNRNELGADKDDFDIQIEKVADSFFEFLPSATEAADIGVEKSTSFSASLRTSVVALGIVNIRVIKKIESFCARIEPMLADFDNRIFSQAVQSIALFAFAKLQPNLAPDLDWIASYNEFRTTEEENDEIKSQWSKLLSNYQFVHVDEFDMALLHGVRRGYFDEKEIRLRATVSQQSLSLQDQDNSMHQAWRLYHDSFDDNQNDVLDKLDSAFLENYAAVTPLNVGGIAMIFKELGRPQRSRELVEFYVNNRAADPEFWNLKDYSFGSEITDPDVIELFSTKYQSVKPESDSPRDILLRIAKDSGWGQSDTQTLCGVSEEEFIEMFKSTRGSDLRRITREALRFANRYDEEMPEHQIGVRANAALQKIADESEINARRVKVHRSNL